uniref:Uncharacterized protein n=1 Tax=Anguilla anguilla TaxID=7936 RepID=A0A0E9X6R5_ANGAN
MLLICLWSLFQYANLNLTFTFFCDHPVCETIIPLKFTLLPDTCSVIIKVIFNFFFYMFLIESLSYANASACC